MAIGLLLKTPKSKSPSTHCVKSFNKGAYSMEETYYLLTGIQYSSRPSHHWETSGKRPEAPLLGDDIVFQTLMQSHY